MLAAGPAGRLGAVLRGGTLVANLSAALTPFAPSLPWTGTAMLLDRPDAAADPADPAATETAAVPYQIELRAVAETTTTWILPFETLAGGFPVTLLAAAAAAFDTTAGIADAVVAAAGPCHSGDGGGGHVACGPGGYCHARTRACVCRAGFRGAACDQCAPGHYGAACRPCACGAPGEGPLTGGVPTRRLRALRAAATGPRALGLVGATDGGGGGGATPQPLCRDGMAGDGACDDPLRTRHALAPRMPPTCALGAVLPASAGAGLPAAAACSCGAGVAALDPATRRLVCVCRPPFRRDADGTCWTCPDGTALVAIDPTAPPPAAADADAAADAADAETPPGSRARYGGNAQLGEYLCAPTAPTLARRAMQHADGAAANVAAAADGHDHGHVPVQYWDVACAVRNQTTARPFDAAGTAAVEAATTPEERAAAEAVDAAPPPPPLLSVLSAHGMVLREWCDACTPGWLLHHGRCVRVCPVGTVAHVVFAPATPLGFAATCEPCGGDCATCPSADRPDVCLTCRDAGRRPDAAGRCLPPSLWAAAAAPHAAAADADAGLCPRGQFFDAAQQTCRDCALRCGACRAYAPCDVCAPGMAPRDGFCRPVLGAADDAASAAIAAFHAAARAGARRARAEHAAEQHASATRRLRHTTAPAAPAAVPTAAAARRGHHVRREHDATDHAVPGADHGADHLYGDTPETAAYLANGVHHFSVLYLVLMIVGGFFALGAVVMLAVHLHHRWVHHRRRGGDRTARRRRFRRSATRRSGDAAEQTEHAALLAGRQRSGSLDSLAAPHRATPRDDDQRRRRRSLSAHVSDGDDRSEDYQDGSVSDGLDEARLCSDYAHRLQAGTPTAAAAPTALARWTMAVPAWFRSASRAAAMAPAGRRHDSCADLSSPELRQAFASGLGPAAEPRVSAADPRSVANRTSRFIGRGAHGHRWSFLGAGVAVAGGVDPASGAPRLVAYAPVPSGSGAPSSAVAAAPPSPSATIAAAAARAAARATAWLPHSRFATAGDDIELGRLPAPATTAPAPFVPAPGPSRRASSAPPGQRHSRLMMTLRPPSSPPPPPPKAAGAKASHTSLPSAVLPPGAGHRLSMADTVRQARDDVRHILAGLQIQLSSESLLDEVVEALAEDQMLPRERGLLGSDASDVSDSDDVSVTPSTSAGSGSPSGATTPLSAGRGRRLSAPSSLSTADLRVESVHLDVVAEGASSDGDQRGSRDGELPAMLTLDEANDAEADDGDGDGDDDDDGDDGDDDEQDVDEESLNELRTLLAQRAQARQEPVVVPTPAQVRAYRHSLRLSRRPSLRPAHSDDARALAEDAAAEAAAEAAGSPVDDAAAIDAAIDAALHAPEPGLAPEAADAGGHELDEAFGMRPGADAAPGSRHRRPSGRAFPFPAPAAARRPSPRTRPRMKALQLLTAGPADGTTAPPPSAEPAGDAPASHAM
ncbi:hypothetical protein CXG81DRAFT_18207 [Caulochytrium protostelioides]|uniref:EGF-like domain-containing protein n=1 Tax=Caulochytrium protostelioides TaxID=1555241 RepID=A0A4P9X9S1_9FUNG|nr:hypothetical protein CXG81DRAFT_18207 [Caulochytrium protostelioides]|eukprot:RKP02103.1 hypothetical protein CXG81DRAFT_18207 [Caulochytrium protostelioides]